METVKQKTLKGSFSLFGKGLHTGLSLTVTFNPAPEILAIRYKELILMDSLLLMLLQRMLLIHSVEQYWLRVRHVLVRLNMVCQPFMQWVLITVLYRLMVLNSLSSMALQQCMLIKSMRLVSLIRMLQGLLYHSQED